MFGLKHRVGRDALQSDTNIFVSPLWYLHGLDVWVHQQGMKPEHRAIGKGSWISPSRHAVSQKHTLESKSKVFSFKYIMNIYHFKYRKTKFIANQIFIIYQLILQVIWMFSFDVIWPKTARNFQIKGSINKIHVHVMFIYVKRHTLCALKRKDKRPFQFLQIHVSSSENLTYLTTVWWFWQYRLFCRSQAIGRASISDPSHHLPGNSSN